MLAGAEPDSRVTFTVGRGKTSQMTGQHRQNLDWLQERFALREIKVTENQEGNREILTVSVEK